MGRVSAQNGSYPQLSLFMEVINRIQNDYVDAPDIAAAMDGAIRGMVEQVDPHGGYLSPDVASFYRDYDPWTSSGIGVRLSKRFGYPAIVAAVPGGPADRAGLTTGDTIEAIGGESLREHNLIEVLHLLSGDPGTEVELTVIRPTRPEPSRLQVSREVVAVPPIETRLLDGNIGYLKISLLAPGKASEAERQIERLQQQGASRFVLDLRNSAGGGRDEGLMLADVFIESGVLGYLEGQTVERETFSATADGTLTELPLVLLINQGTADGAEIAAAAMRDNGRAELVGVRTFGLGSVQELLSLDDGWALLLAVANHYSPAGLDIEQDGVAPTVEVTATAPLDPLAAPNDSASPEDRQLNRAIEILIEEAGERAA